MREKSLLFLGGFGVPSALFEPWYAKLSKDGYDVHVVPNSAMSMHAVSRFAETFLDLARQFETFDVIGLSYGGNAALYAAHLDLEVLGRADKVVLVCAPVLGAPGLMRSIRGFLPGFLSASLDEMAKEGHVCRSIRDLAGRAPLPFDLHCIYHERDRIAPREVATLPGVGTNHPLGFDWKCIPSLAMHQAASIDPRTLATARRILAGG